MPAIRKRQRRQDHENNDGPQRSGEVVHEHATRSDHMRSAATNRQTMSVQKNRIATTAADTCRLVSMSAVSIMVAPVL
jgi:hypothetical protein